MEKEKPEFIEEIDYYLTEIIKMIKKFNIKELVLVFKPNGYSVEWKTEEKYEEFKKVR
jgi:hypothetical protein